MARKGSKKCPAPDQPASQPAAPAQILPPLPVTGGLDGEDPGADLFDPDELPPALAFTPVARKRIRSNGLSPMRQRAFIAYLAANGCVEMSAAAVGASDTAFYQLRKAEGAESFANAWDVAIDMGARRVLDRLMAHAIHGTPERLVKDGKVILERRRFNARAMMWIVQQRLPELYGGSLNLSARPASSLPHGLQKLKEQWRAEWEAEAAQHSAETSAEEAAALNSMAATLDRIVRKYQAKVREEAYFRMSGNAIAADFALRQLTQIELVLDIGGISMELIAQHFHNAAHGGPWTSHVSRALEDARHAAWEQSSAAAIADHARSAQGAGGDAGQGVADDQRPAIEPYTRPRMPFYLNEEDMAKDEAARGRLNWLSGDQRQRAAAEAEWRANRRIESEEPGEGDTFLPEG